MKIAGVVMTALSSSLAIVGCSSATTTDEVVVTSVTIIAGQPSVMPIVASTTTAASTTSGSTSVADSTTSSMVGATTGSGVSSGVSSVASSIASAAKSTTTTVSAVTTNTTLVLANRPKLSVSQTINLNPNGTLVTVRGTGYDVKKGVYVIVCTQAAPGPQATCIGGVNIDGSSSSSVWVSSNPPNYGVGLTTPFSVDGSFTVELVVVAKSGALDCTVMKCGVVTRSDHLRYTDRTQDVFVPVSFSN